MLPIAELRGAVGRVRKLVRKQSFSFIPWFKRWCRSKPRFYFSRNEFFVRKKQTFGNPAFGSNPGF